MLKHTIIGIAIAICCSGCLHQSTSVVDPSYLAENNSEIQCFDYEYHRQALSEINDNRKKGWRALTITDLNYSTWIFGFTYNRVRVCYGKGEQNSSNTK
ncbi:MAG: hypothetical protein JXR76_02195 [Deltaproteobacteria bacterium]|nr:hypothetical protein [Deltaproteobacteria bacterium]